ncbi:MAG: PD-(D/E)XK nuclease family protein [Planctomycetes bacterium]|nr:PD-(D/E)XK nuclease family protein [Planctomycetota bacterium]
MKPARLPPDFLADLKAVAPAPPDQTVSTQFLKDLATVDKSVREAEARQSVSDEDFRFIAERLQEWRSNTRKKLEMLIGRLPEDDPLRCPISLFATMDYGRLETAHTRTLAWLLDPDKEHGFGSKLLEALLSCVEKQDLPVQVHRVESEWFIEEPARRETSGRVDIFAEGNWMESEEDRIPWRLVVEAKIDAWEGEEQLTFYEDWLDSFADNRQVLRVFLTPEGRQPETARQNWFPLKFQELVEAFRAAADALRDKPGYHYLRFYLAGVLRDVCRWPLPIRLDCSDPYSVLSYLRHAIDR